MRAGWKARAARWRTRARSSCSPSAALFGWQGNVGLVVSPRRRGTPWVSSTMSGLAATYWQVTPPGSPAQVEAVRASGPSAPRAQRAPQRRRRASDAAARATFECVRKRAPRALAASTGEATVCARRASRWCVRRASPQTHASAPSSSTTPRLRARPLGRPLHVVLVEPEIPPNTGNVARLVRGHGLAAPPRGPARLPHRRARACGARGSTTGTSSTSASTSTSSTSCTPGRRRRRAAGSTSSAPSPPRATSTPASPPGDALVFGRESVGLPRRAPRALPRPRRRHPHPGRRPLAEPRQRRRHRPLRGAAPDGRAGRHFHGLGARAPVNVPVPVARARDLALKAHLPFRPGIGHVYGHGTCTRARVFDEPAALTRTRRCP